MRKSYRNLAALVLIMLMLIAAPFSPALASTMGEKNALRSAQNYLSFMPFSHEGLIAQLEYEGYTLKEATYAADSCEANWNEQAYKKALSYLDFMAFSKDGLIDQLEYDKFTPEQARLGAAVAYGDLPESALGLDANTSITVPQADHSSTSASNALRSAKNYLNFMAFSYSGLIAQLEYEQYSRADAVYAADNCGANWNEQAAKKAKDYLSFMSFSKAGLIKQLEFDGFTAEQAAYGAKQNGY